MRQLFVAAAAGLLAASVAVDVADARPGFRGDGGGFHSGAGFRPGWNGGGMQWWPNPGWQPNPSGRLGWGWGNGWGWAAAGTLAYDPYGYSAYDSCPNVQRRVWDGYGYRITWLNSCTGY